jgi:group I intron endonuclease
MKYSGLYQIQSKIKPERIYIGSAVSIGNRWCCHLHGLRRNKHSNNKLQNHYNKYGESDLQFSVLLSCDKKDLIKTEQFFIDSLNPWFNICQKANSHLGIKMSEEAKRKMSLAKIGIKLSDEHRKKISAKGKNRKHSDETKRKLSELHKGEKTTIMANILH